MHLLNNRLGRLTALIAMGGAALYSQGTQTTNITGSVVDGAGAPLAGVTVRLTSPALQGVRTYTSDSAGKFIARLLPPGFYTVQLNKDGFEARKITQQLGIDQTFSPKITLTKMGGAVVEVIAAPPAVDKTDVKSSTNYRLDAVDQLPNARSMEGVALLTPGVTSGVGGRVQIRGAQTSGNLYLLDGQNIADNAYNNRGLAVIDDSIEETQIITGALPAEYGDVEGGVINSITRSGSNSFSGSLRWELTNPSWNNVVPFQNKVTANRNKLGQTKTLSLSGPIIKDKLWFAGSFFTTDTTTNQTIAGNLSGAPYNAANGPDGYNTPYPYLRKEIRRQLKLTWSINQDHTLVASYMRNATDDTNRDYSAGEILALVPQISTSDFLNVALRSTWTSNLTSELRVGNKNQKLSAGGSANGQSPIYLYGVGRFYNNGIFNNTDGGDNRENKTLNAKVSLFWDMAGSHQSDFGVDYYEGIRRARNEQSPTNLIFGTRGLNVATRTAIPLDVWVFESTPGSAKNFSYGLYVNDKWSLDQHWNFQIGLRWDKYKAQDESGTSTAGADGLSPRLGVKFDLFGDSKHIFGLSYARYNGKVLEGITNSVTGQGNPKEIDYYANSFIAAGGAVLEANRLSFADIQNMANYDLSAIAYYNDPKLNVKLFDKMKAPTVDEIQGSYAYAFNFGAYGDGFIKATGVYKKWNNLMDVSVGNNGTVANPDPAGDPLYIKYWDNNPDAKRKYKALELETQYNLNQWTYGGNITWSTLEGNYEGEGTNTPGRGESIHNFDVQDGVQLYDSNWTAPYGYLSGHVPIRMRFTASRVFNNAYGKTSVGLVYRFDSGSHYSFTRSITPAQLGGPTLSGQFGSTAVQYMDQKRGAGVYNATAYLDLAITHDFPLFKIGSKAVTAFAKVAIGNVFNHMQIVTFNTSFNPVLASESYPTAVNSPWVVTPATGSPYLGLYSGYGQVQGATNYGTARTYAVSTGFRF